jgi:regulator of sigma E protease
MSIFLTILGLALLILVHEFGHFICAKVFGIRVDEFGIGFPPRIFGKKIGETLYSINGLPLGGFVRLAGETVTPEALKDQRSFSAAPALQRTIVVAAGVAMNVVVGWALIATVLFVGTPNAIVIDEVKIDTPAAMAGLKAGDVIQGFVEAKLFTEFVQAHKGEKIKLNIVRAREPQALEATLTQDVLGVVVVDAGISSRSMLASMRDAAAITVAMLVGVFQGLGSVAWALVTQGKLLEGLVGPVGVFGIAGAAAKTGFMYFVQLLGIISINLAALNSIPFPALDGGRLLMIIVEKIKGSRLTPMFEIVVNSVGFGLLILFMVAVTIRDVGQL